MRVLGVAIALVAADVAALFFAVVTGNEENCDNGISRWQCSGALRDMSPVAFVVLLALTVIFVAWYLATRRPSK